MSDKKDNSFRLSPVFSQIVIAGISSFLAYYAAVKQDIVTEKRINNIILYNSFSDRVAELNNVCPFDSTNTFNVKKVSFNSLFDSRANRIDDLDIKTALMEIRNCIDNEIIKSNNCDHCTDYYVDVLKQIDTKVKLHYEN